MRKEKRAASEAEKTIIDAAEAAREIIIQVDSFERIGKELNQPEEWTASERPAYSSSYAYAEAVPVR